MTSLGRLARTLTAALTTLAALAAPPAALAAFVGWPLPHSLPTAATARDALTGPLSDRFLIDALACLAWLLWSLFTLALVTELVALLRGRTAPRLPGLGPLQALAATLLGAATLALLPAVSRTLPAPPAAAVAADGYRPLAAHTPTAPVTARPHATHANPAATSPAATSPAPTGAAPTCQTHRVHHGDTLWSIAHQHLDDGERWRDIFHLNHGRPQPDGRALTDPDLIRPGWVLLLPAPSPTPDRPAPPPSSKPPPSPAPTSSPRPSSPSASSPSASGRSASPPSTPPPSAPSHPANQAPPHPPHHSGTGQGSTQSSGTAEPSEIPEPSSDGSSPARRAPVAISLPSGTLIGIGLVTALALAIALMRLHRRRHRRPSPRPGTQPPEPELPPPLRRVRHTYLHHTDPTADQPTPDEPDGAPDVRVAPRFRALPASDTPSGESESGPRPEAINIAADDDRELPVLLDAADGVGLVGDGAAATARALIVTLLADRTHHESRVVLPRPDADQLFGPGLVTLQIPGLIITDHIATALDHLETELLHRTRLLDTADSDNTPDLAAYRHDHPDEPLGTVLLVTTPDPGHAERAASILAAGRPLAITGILLGRWPHGGTCTIDPTGPVIAADGPAVHHLIGAHAYQLTTTEARDILTTLAAAHGHPEPNTHTAQPPADRPAADRPAADQPVADQPDPTPNGYAPSRPSEPAPQAPVQLSLLGPLTLTAAGHLVTKGLRRKSLELLTYLALHPDGATTDTLTDALWPDAPTDNAANSLYTVTANLRTTLRTATGRPEARFLERNGNRYVLDFTLIDTDYRRFRAALHTAHTTADPRDQRAAYHRAITEIRGTTDTWPAAEWLERWRETLRRDITDTLARLADLHRPDDPEHALTLLQQALHHDPYAEELYRRTMQLQADLGHPDAALHTYRTLETHLLDLDTEPDNTTHALLTNIRATARTPHARQPNSGAQQPNGQRSS
ncbi:BTAD domain-containing putative transcriptional regulator [Actinomadura rupiterrae]|uniref:BTAD domain-containing putative transcriptional regulator n=1 Tax=Actinomadura rupiterrae TaxID=559627 RepID=UPI0020A47136|nr:BTAD domain-containing putative transcriptional regulator [Actinomadura rupiterrae]MCP2335233.1 DNA-binding SARP family transcriptional activator/LysM repeat protein [Actinomadura rupiterrae]